MFDVNRINSFAYNYAGVNCEQFFFVVTVKGGVTQPVDKCSCVSFTIVVSLFPLVLLISENSVEFII
uniref:Receptor expression-enhancing protein n=1 Tax=Parascaris univalens TaxID=6257 RepID=A0A915C404_PARUN